MSSQFVPLVIAVLFVSFGCGQTDVEFKRAPIKDLGETLRFVGHDEPVECLAISKDGKRLLSGCGRPELVNGKPIKVTDRSIRLWDVETGKELLKMDGHSDTVASVAFSPDRTTAVSGSWDGTIRFWDLATGKETKQINDHASPVLCVGYFSDGDRIYSAGVDSTIRIWNAETGKLIHTFGPKIRLLRAAALSRDETQIFAGGTFHTVWNWSIADGQLLHTLECRDEIMSLAVAPHTEQLLFVTSHDSIRLVDITTNTTVREFAGYGADCSVFTSDGRRFASCGRDGTLRIWDTNTGKRVKIVEGFPDGLNCVVITPDDKSVIVAGGGRHPDMLDFTIRMWTISGE